MRLTRGIQPWLSGAVLFAFLACGGNGDGPTAPEVSTGTIEVINDSSQQLVTVNISRCEIDLWGENRIGSPINPGTRRSFDLVPNCYDVRVISVTGQELTFFDIVLQARETEQVLIFDV
jgi:hypothetical protein